MEKQMRYMTKAAWTLAAVLVAAACAWAAPGTAAADEARAPRDHQMNEQNLWLISTELVMPGDTVSTERKRDEVEGRTVLGVTTPTVVYDRHLFLSMEGAQVDVSRLVRSRASADGLVPSATEPYDAFDGYEAPEGWTVQSGEPRQVVTAWRNDTGCPLVIAATTMSQPQREGSVTDDATPPAERIVAFSTGAESPIIVAYEPWYALSYEGMTEAEAAGAPDRYYVSDQEQQLALPQLANTRPGKHFAGYRGPAFMASALDNRTEDDEHVTYTLTWDLLRLLDFGDETVTATFEAGPTLTFHTQGGTLDGQLVEVDAEGGAIDVTAYVPTREGWTFAGWCTDEDTGEESLIADGKLAFDPLADDPDIQLHARWTEGEPEPEPQPDPESALPFSDVDPGAYYFDAVIWANDAEVTTGYADGTFRPGATCSRAQVVTFLWRAQGQPEPTLRRNPFRDVHEDDYYYKAVLWAVENRITTGTSATTFDPQAECTRAQVVTFLWRSQGRPAAHTASDFADVTRQAYYAEAVDWAVERQVTTGTSTTTFSPQRPCTRGHVVTFLYRTDQSLA